MEKNKINFDILWNHFKPIIVNIFSNTFGSNCFKLDKSVLPMEVISIYEAPKLLQLYDSIDLEAIGRLKFSDLIMEFVSVVVNRFPLDDLVNFYNNLNRLDVYSNRFERFHFNGSRLVVTAGKYNVKGNYIIINGKKNRTVIYHELFHLASSVYSDNLGYTGFCQYTSDSSFGAGINEGYTELLAERYFDKQLKGAYLLEIQFAYLVEKIVGTERMSSLYLRADLNGLISELAKYSSEEEAINFISNIDFLSFSTISSIGDYEKNEFLNIFREVNEFLYKAYITKAKKRFENGEFDLDGFWHQACVFAFMLQSSIKIKNKEYEVVDIENLLDIFNDVTVDVFSPKSHFV